MLTAIGLQGPDPGIDGVSTWRLVDLCRIVRERLGVSYDESGLRKLLHRLELPWQTPRPRHAETDRAAEERFKKVTSPPRSRRLRPTPPKPNASRSASGTRHA